MRRAALGLRPAAAHGRSASGGQWRATASPAQAARPSKWPKKLRQAQPLSSLCIRSAACASLPHYRVWHLLA